MNNNNNPAILKSLIVYAVCVPLAIWIGYLLTEPLDRTSLSIAGILALLLITPVLLRWHHFLLVASLNLALSIFFLPGSPPLWMFMVALSLGISVLHRTLNNKERFISAPEITMPLICLLVVVFFTAKLTGGIGLRSLGNETMGGKRYLFILFAVLVYFALTAQRIPPKRVGLYVTAFFFGGFFTVIGDLPGIMPIPTFFNFIFAIFPPSGYDFHQVGARFNGVAGMAVFGFYLMLAKYGVRGIFLSGRLWRLPVFVLLVVLIFVGGFRSYIISCALIFFILFFLERMQHTKLLLVFIFAGIITAALCIPFANKLPYTFQRSLAFLPLKLDPLARYDAEQSTEWRLQIWQAVLPQVPSHLLLGKGYALSQSDVQEMTTAGFSSIGAEDWGSSIAGDYHNGPLSVILPFGIWGVIVLFWFFIAAGRALYNNYRYSDPELRTVNTFLFVLLFTRIILFFIVFGSLYSDMITFTGIVGLSISLNGGIRRMAAAPVEKEVAVKISAPARPRLQPFYQP